MPPITTYTLTRTFGDGDESPYHSTSFTSSDTDAINCAHMLAAGFNTMSRNFLLDYALAVVDTKTGTVYYDGKHEQVDRYDAFPARPEYAHIARGVLEDAYTEIGIVNSILSDVGVETIPSSSGVREMQHMLRSRDGEIAGLIAERANANADAIAEMVSYVKRAHAKKLRIQQAIKATGEQRNDLDDRWRGMLDTLAKLLVVLGEADADEGHAVARRLCGIEEGAP